MTSVEQRRRRPHSGRCHREHGQRDQQHPLAAEAVAEVTIQAALRSSRPAGKRRPPTTRTRSRRGGSRSSATRSRGSSGRPRRGTSRPSRPERPAGTLRAPTAASRKSRSSRGPRGHARRVPRESGRALAAAGRVSCANMARQGGFSCAGIVCSDLFVQCHCDGRCDCFSFPYPVASMNAFRR